MLKRTLAIGAVILSCTGTAIAAQTLVERMHSGRMTVIKVDVETSRFMCAEHRRWTTAAKSDLRAVRTGDIVRVTVQDELPARVAVLRTAAEELGSPE